MRSAATCSCGPAVCPQTKGYGSVPRIAATFLDAEGGYRRIMGHKDL